MVRSTAAVGLRMLGSKLAIPSLSKATNDPSSLVRGDVVSALGALGGREEVPLLCRILWKDRNPGVRAEAARALGRIGGDEAVAALVEELSNYYQDESVTFACHRALVRLTGKDLPPRASAWKSEDRR